MISRQSQLSIADVPGYHLVVSSNGAVVCASDDYLTAAGLNLSDIKNQPFLSWFKPASPVLKASLKRAVTSGQSQVLAAQPYWKTFFLAKAGGMGNGSWKVIFKPLPAAKSSARRILISLTQIERALTTKSQLDPDIQTLQLEDELYLKDLDITDLKRKIEELNRRNFLQSEQFRLLGDALPFGFWMSNNAGEFTFISDSLLRFLGISRAEVGQNPQMRTLVHSWRAERSKGEAWSQEFQLRGVMGKTATVLNCGRPVHNADRRLVGWVGLHLDVSKNKSAQVDLMNSNELFAQLVENLRDQAIWMTSVPDNRVIYGSPSVERVLKFDAFDFSNRAIRLTHVHPDDRDRVDQAMTRQMKGLNTHEDYRIIGQEGGVRWISEKSFPVRNLHGRIYRIAHVAADITGQKNYESNLQAAVDAANHANNAKSQFLANMSHEIRTPLGAILGYTELLAKAGGRNLKEKSISVIHRNANQLLYIINQILDLSQVEHNRLPVEKLSVSSCEVADDVMTLLREKAAKKGIALSMTVNASEPPPFIYTDPSLLSRILINIVGNAIKFTEAGAVDVELKWHWLEYKKSVSLHFLVRDTGCGIARAKHNKLFQPFSQADASTKRKFGGTGLGLVLAREYAKALGGNVTLLESAEGQGSSFCIEIRGEVSPPKAASAPPLKVKQKQPTSSLKRLKVLVVDDAEDNRELMSYYLEASGAAVDCAVSGRDALAQAATKKYDLILMDIQMPGLDGYETAGELRARHFEKPIFAVTAHAMKEEREKCLRAGFDEHLSKPIDRARLIETIARFMGTTKH